MNVIPSSIILNPGKKAYFASDIHLGLYPVNESLKREQKFIQWLSEIKASTEVLFLVGDVFDFWYEYRKVIPRNYTRFLGKLCEFVDSGIPVIMFTGNHDVWMFDYFQNEIGVAVCKEPIEVEINKKQFYIGHGDGVGPGDNSYKLLKKVFTSKFMQFCFSRLHPNFAYFLGQSWSKHSRYSKGIADTFHGIDKEYNILFAKDYITQKHIDYFIFGHRHIPMDIGIGPNSRLYNLGEWIAGNTYAEFDGESIEIKDYNPWKKQEIIRM